MASLEALPDELLLHICRHLSLSDEFVSGFDGAAVLGDETRALSRLCRLSKRLQPFAQRALYDNIPQLSPENRYRLLRTFVDYPHLARLVRAMNMGDCSIAGSELMSLFRAAQPRLNVSARLEEIATARAGLESEGFDSAFVLLLLPNLELLEIEVRGELDYEMCDLVDEIRADASGPPIALGRLRELRIRHSDTEDADTLKPQGLLTLPTLRTLRGWSVQWGGLYPDDRADGHVETHSECLSVEHVDFSWSLCDGFSLSAMLFHCPDLKTLRIEWGPSTVGCDDNLDFSDMGDALRKHGGNLERLTLDIREAFMYEEGESTGRIGSLRELSKLKYIALTHDMLVGEDDGSDEDSDDESSGPKERSLQLGEVLPVSLEELRLYTCEGEEGHLDDQLHEIIAGKKLTNLRKVVMECRKTSFRHDLSESGWVAGQAWGKVILCKKAEYRPMSKAVEDWSLRHGSNLQIPGVGAADVSNFEET